MLPRLDLGIEKAETIRIKLILKININNFKIMFILV